MHFYSSVNNNYFPKARILAKSIKKHIPNSKFSLILSDKIKDGILLEDEPFDEILTIDQLNIPVDNLPLWIYKHTVVELCTAVKGQALVKFLEEGSDKVIYLDPDIVVFDNLSELDELLDKYDVILTPHQTIPEDNKKNIEHNEICSLQHGIYNFGFYAVKNTENGLTYAKWWRDRLIDYCFDDIPNGLFTDQRWGDLAPALFENVHIWKNPACNVSTWNLSHRNVTKKIDKYYVNDLPLQFYHFSGFDSGAQENMLNVHGKDNVALFELREWYIQRMQENGQDEFGNKPSIYDFYDNGEKIKKDERLLFRNRTDLQDYFVKYNPFIVEQEFSFYKWLAAEGYLSDDIDKTIENPAQIQLEKIYSSQSWKLAQKIAKLYKFFNKKKS